MDRIGRVPQEARTAQQQAFEPEPNTHFIDLVQRFQNGDNEAFETLYSELAPVIHKYTFRQVHNKELAEDLTADVFTRVYGQIGSYKDRGLPFTAWLYRIAQNRIIDSAKRPKIIVGSIDVIPKIADMPSPQPPFEDQIAVRSVIWPILSKITPHYLEFIQMRYFKDMSQIEIAKSTGRSIDSVKQIQGRALAEIREALKVATLLDERANTPNNWRYRPELDQNNPTTSNEDIDPTQD